MSRMSQIRNVADDLHSQPRAGAALEVCSLSEYLLREVRRVAERPSPRADRLNRDARVVGGSAPMLRLRRTWDRRFIYLIRRARPD